MAYLQQGSLTPLLRDGMTRNDWLSPVNLTGIEQMDYRCCMHVTGRINYSYNSIVSNYSFSM